MAKKSVILRQERRVAAVAKYAERRAALIAVLKDPNADLDAKEVARKQLYKMPRDASPVRQHNRCKITGRPRGYHRKFGISRVLLRKLAHKGELPGVRKASW